MKKAKALGILCLILSILTALAALSGSLMGSGTPLDALLVEATAAQDAAARAASAAKSAATAVKKAASAQKAVEGAEQGARDALVTLGALSELKEGASGDLNALRAAAEDALLKLSDASEIAGSLETAIRSLLEGGADMPGHLSGAKDAVDGAAADLRLLAKGLEELALTQLRQEAEKLGQVVEKAELQLIEAGDAADKALKAAGETEMTPDPQGSFPALRPDAPQADCLAYAETLSNRARELLTVSEGVTAGAERARQTAGALSERATLSGRDGAVLFLRENLLSLGFTAALLLIVALICLIFPARFSAAWKRNPVFSTFVALLVMLAFQTYALGFNFPSVGAWLSFWVSNAFNVLRANTSVGMIALGMTLVVITGGIDLAVGSTLAGVGTVMMVLMDTSPRGWLTRLGLSGVPLELIGVAGGLLAGMGIGALIGLAVTKGRVPPFIVTLGVMNIVRSVAQYFTKDYTPKIPDDFTGIANTVVFGQRLLPIVYWLILAVLLYIVANKTSFGRYAYAVGSNERTTRLSGINVDKVKFKVYTLMGLIVSVASVTQLSRMGGMDVASSGSGYELDSIAAVVVGGTSMSGGRGSILGTVIGVLIIGVMNNVLILLGVDSFLNHAFKGAIVVLAVLMQRKN